MGCIKYLINFIYQQTVIFNQIIKMRLKLIKSTSRSMLDNPEKFTGWDSKQTEEDSNIFKLLRDNLNSYQYQYNRLHSHDKYPLKKQLPLKNNNRENKQNHVKLPIIQTTPLKQKSFTKKSSLEKTIKHLQSIMSYEMIKKEPTPLFQQIQRSNLRQFREIKSQQFKKSNDNTVDKVFLKKNKFFSISRTLKYKHLRQKGFDNLIQYQFSDEKIIKHKNTFMNDVRCYSNLDIQ